MADDEETAVTEEDKLRIKVLNVIIAKLNQSMTNRFADHKNPYLDISCFDPKRLSDLKKGLASNAFDKICDLVPNIDKGKLIEELESFVQDWPQISSSLTEEFSRDANMESDSESERSEEMVQNEVRTCRMEYSCKGCIDCAYKCEKDKLVALDNDMVIDKLCEQSEEMRRLLVL
ncbi:hypothetical protein PR048_016988 [Dryococelus australis]|uniref:Uncharacterized protein n=1 Tax=Dryococelus australis TaxID=614101 RepID=A0ABQ9H888_9NEOP|nr:hypothetical protein PR048_016988 [Dryococelus australis]